MFKVSHEGKVYTARLWDGRSEPSSQMKWHLCPMCAGVVSTHSDDLKQGRIAVHTTCYEKGQQEETPTCPA